MKKLLLLLMIVPMIGLGQETGCISGDCENGYGIWVLPNGNRYVGEFKDGMANGHGTYTFGEGPNKGNIYNGKFKDNTRCGQGTMIWANGAKYVGEWIDSERYGQGTMIYEDGAKYVGEWRDTKDNENVWHGKGTFTLPNGDYHKTLFVNGRFISSECFDKHGNEINCE
jgi:hypothetical protein